MILHRRRSLLRLLMAGAGLLLVSSLLAAAPLYRVTAVPGAATFGVFDPRVSLTDDGRDVCFDGRSYGYWTGDMYLGDSVGVWQYDFTTYVLSLLTRSAGGQYPQGRCHQPIISGDGNVVLFKSSATDLTASPMPDGLYAYDLVKGVYDRCDVSSDGLIAAADTDHYPCISRDGRYVVFVTSTKLAVEDTNDTADVYLRDRVARKTTLQSVSSAGAQGTGSSDHMECAVSGDGKSIAFTSDTSGLVPDVVSPGHRVYLRRVTASGGTTTLLSRTRLGLNPGVPIIGYYPSISA
ncbi:MAG: hypothetical protein WCP21_07365, partial [Armatimonadota bacterium]